MTPERPSTNDRDAWKIYWAAQDMPWRTEPEIDQERQRFLAERRAIQPNIKEGMYPFRDAQGSITLHAVRQLGDAGHPPAVAQVPDLEDLLDGVLAGRARRRRRGCRQR
jgi:hypothetical protein